MRSSDWSSDVCSSELKVNGQRVFLWSRPEHASAFIFDEVTDFSAKADRSGSTMISTILSMTTASTIGGVRAGNIDSTLHAGTYRATLTIGGQPGRCDSLVSTDAVARGVAGRFLWVRSGLERAEAPQPNRSEEHTSELQSLMRISYAVFCLKKKKQT